MERAGAFFVWMLPVLWGAGSVAQWWSPGDENGFYILSSLPAAWVAPVIFLGHPPREMTPVLVVLAGAPVMAGLGWGMDCLRIRKAVWAVLYLAGGIAMLYVTLRTCPNLTVAVRINGPLWGHVLLAANVGLYQSIVFSVALTCVVRAGRWSRGVAQEAGQVLRQPECDEPR
ncbi:MAG: hypothetical protein MUC88_16695 [Planctomycetes bacterium]|nr:hypothetical protein [Planctomycetota bacterium]